MELEVLGRLDCELSFAYSLEFLRRFSRVAEDKIDPREYILSKVMLMLLIFLLTVVFSTCASLL